jgi:hypothetical protein
MVLGVWGMRASELPFGGGDGDNDQGSVLGDRLGGITFVDLQEGGQDDRVSLHLPAASLLSYNM